MLVVIDLAAGLPPGLNWLTYGIWLVFVLDFVAGVLIAPSKRRFLRRNWLSGVALILPALGALRVFRIVRALRLARSVRAVSMLRLMTSLNRGLRALRRALGQRGIGYAILVTVMVVLAGAGGLTYFEGPRAPGRPASGAAGFETFPEAVWWTAAVMTTLGPEAWPQTTEGRILAWLLSLYALGVFGYLTGNIASYFIGATGTRPPAAERELAALAREVSELRRQIQESQDPAGRQPGH